MRKMMPLLVLTLLGCRETPKPPPYKPVADVKLLMQAVVDPAADVVWGAVGTIVSKDGTQEFFPKDDAEWALVRNSAVVLAESGNLLMMGSRPKDDGEWMRHCRELIDAGTRAAKAAEAKDKQAVFGVGGEIYAVCSGCHETYQVKVVEP